MVYRVFAAALVAGVLAGLAAFGLQQARISPLIQQAEVYEAAGEPAGQQNTPHDHATHDHGAGTQQQAAPAGHDHGGAWEPEGAARHGLTLLADILAGVGFALLLTGAMSVAETRGHGVDLKRGLLWGAAGFAIFSAAPAMGLPPELPGMQAADLEHRQLWWIATAAATAAGLGFAFFARPIVARALGVVLIVLPHVFGAPAHEGGAGLVPPELAAQFVTASLVTSALFWLVAGGAAGWLYERLGRQGPADVAAV
jgi:cobalt transporter subunit CbtA